MILTTLTTLGTAVMVTAGVATEGAAASSAFGALLSGIGAGLAVVGKTVGNIVMWSVTITLVNSVKTKAEKKLAAYQEKSKS